MEALNTMSPLDRLVSRQEWLSGVGDRMQRVVEAAFERAGSSRRPLRNLLHGTWLGHPLHPVLTDIPAGAWTLALLFDGLARVRGQREFRVAADAAVGVGLTGALGAAATGLADWSASDDPARRVGVAHGLLNSAAAATYAASLALRLAGARGAGQALAVVGYGIVSVSSYLGGELISRYRMGVDHAQDQALPGDWVAVLPVEALPENRPCRADAAGIAVLLVRRGQEIAAVGETCSHLGGPLSEGQLAGDCITCPWHGSVFDVRDGRVIEGPATYALPRFTARVRDGQIEVRGATA